MILEPPPQYDFPYPGPLTEWIMPAPKVDAYCRSAGLKAPPHVQVIGCQFKLGEHCFTVLSEHAVVPLRRHETAHCNGSVHP